MNHLGPGDVYLARHSKSEFYSEQRRFLASDLVWSDRISQLKYLLQLSPSHYALVITVLAAFAWSLSTGLK